MRAIAFYLPQYHPIPENDEWWGKGFTEWTNVAKARPRFKGHHQPHIPADLSFYDLRVEETRIAQAELAKQYGIGGFCYYHYWFNGKMLLERPFDEVLKSGKPDFPFCLCWANENWTRRWDGREKEILIEQKTDLYDAIAHINWLRKAFADSRYLRINGKPLFIVYRVDLIPNIREVIKQWRIVCGKNGIYLAAVKNHVSTMTDDRVLDLGFDAVLEFQPEMKRLSKDINKNRIRNFFPKLFNAISDKCNSGLHVTNTNIFNYESLVEECTKITAVNYKLFPAVMPSWDNSSRVKSSTVIQNFNVNTYGKWLNHALSRVQNYSKDEQIVFINAWNEWAEGCHLEPDQKMGKSFLEETKRILGNWKD